MKIPIKKMNWFVKILTFNWPIAITLAPFGVYIKEKYYTNHRLMRHESIHWHQQMEMWILPFYIWYFLEWLVKLVTPPVGAYKDISFEREARDYQDEIGYTTRRKRFAWFKYIKG